MTPPMLSPALETVLKASAMLTAAVIGWMTVLRPLCTWICKRRKARKDAVEATLKADREYRQTVLNKLDGLDARMSGLDGCLADLQRDNIERAYCVFVMEHGYCTSGMKQALSDMYESYKARGYNHIAEDRVDAILELPEYPANRKEQPNDH